MNMLSRSIHATAQLITDLGPHALHLHRFDGSESVDGLFCFEIEAEAESTDFDADSLLGTHVTVHFPDAQDGPRYFDGIVTATRMSGTGADGTLVRLTLEPWFKLLEQRQNQRIFHHQDVEEILQALFVPYTGFGAPAVSFKLQQSYPTLEYTVQYGESDLCFARRLMERFGLSFSFQHAEGSHTLLITDAMDAFPAVCGGTRPFVRGDAQHQDYEERFWRWSSLRHVTTGQVRLTDFNFHTPNAKMDAERAAQQGPAHLESVQYPGGYEDAAQGQLMAAIRVRQAQGQDHRHHAEGDCLGLGSGQRVTLDARDGKLSADYVCLSATHAYQNTALRSGNDEGPQYSATYIFVPVAEAYGPAHVTPLARIHGPQTAKVTGEGEIDCDELGRVLVQFHWDLDRVLSMRCRVSQSWAGNGWGSQVIPRVGMEVVVEFLNGDPDKPLVTGCVYNGKNDVPYALPEHKTRTTFRTETHKGQGFNEFRFDDKKDAEEVYTHAQRDLNVKVRNNATARVNVNKVDSIGHNRGVEIGNNDTEIVGGDKHIHIGPSAVGRISPAGDDDHGIGAVGYALGAAGRDPGAGHFDLTVEGDRTSAVNQSDQLDVSKDRKVSVGRNHHVKVAKKLVLEAGDQITLKCGNAKIDICKDGNIRMNGKALNIKMDHVVSMMSGMIKMN